MQILKLKLKLFKELKSFKLISFIQYKAGLVPVSTPASLLRSDLSPRAVTAFFIKNGNIDVLGIVSLMEHLKLLKANIKT